MLDLKVVRGMVYARRRRFDGRELRGSDRDQLGGQVFGLLAVNNGVALLRC